MCFWHRRRPASRPLRLSTFRTAAPLLAHQICLSAAHTTPAMRSRDPCSSATQRSLTAAISCFNSMHLAPECTHAGTPSRAPIYRKYLRAGLTFAHVCTQPCSLILFGPGSLKKAKLRTVRSSGVSGSRSLVWALICVPSRDGSNRLHGAHAGQPLAANRLPSASWHPDRHT